MVFACNPKLYPCKIVRTMTKLGSLAAKTTRSNKKKKKNRQENTLTVVNLFMPFTNSYHQRKIDQNDRLTKKTQALHALSTHLYTSTRTHTHTHTYTHTHIHTHTHRTNIDTHVRSYILSTQYLRCLSSVLIILFFIKVD